MYINVVTVRLIGDLFCTYIYIELGEIFASIGVRELQPNASEAFAIFSEAHRYTNRQIYC